MFIYQYYIGTDGFKNLTFGKNLVPLTVACIVIINPALVAAELLVNPPLYHTPAYWAYPESHSSDRLHKLYNRYFCRASYAKNSSLIIKSDKKTVCL